MTDSPQVDQADLAAHRVLVAALGTEHVANQWMQFMQAIEQYLPLLTRAGRPSAKDVANSLIGHLGHKSWKAMVEAPNEQNGLNWEMGGWNSYRRAWAVVKENPYLLEQPVRAGWVRKIKAECDKAKRPFPASAQELSEYQEERDRVSKEKREASTAGLRDRVSQLETELAEALAAKDQAEADHRASEQSHHTTLTQATASNQQLQQDLAALSQQSHADLTALSEQHRADLLALAEQHQANQAAAAQELAELREHLGAHRQTLQLLQGWGATDHLLCALGRKQIPTIPAPPQPRKQAKNGGSRGNAPAKPKQRKNRRSRQR